MVSNECFFSKITCVQLPFFSSTQVFSFVPLYFPYQTSFHWYTKIESKIWPFTTNRPHTHKHTNTIHQAHFIFKISINLSNPHRSPSHVCVTTAKLKKVNPKRTPIRHCYCTKRTTTKITLKLRKFSSKKNHPYESNVPHYLTLTANAHGDGSGLHALAATGGGVVQYTQAQDGQIYVPRKYFRSVRSSPESQTKKKKRKSKNQQLFPWLA